VYQLNRKISELEHEKMTFNQNTEKLTSLSSYVEKLEDTVAEYRDKLTELEQDNIELSRRIRPSDIEKEISIRDENLIRLQKKLVQLKNQNKELIEKNQVLLKAALLLDVDTEAIDVREKAITPRSTEIPKEPVQDLKSKRRTLLEGREIPKASIEPEIQEEMIEVQNEQEQIHPPEIETC
jgi:predicted RNase H-like nuclease (RuvC/YqgF family)